MTVAVCDFPYGLSVPRASGFPVALFDASGVRVENPTLQSAVRASRVGTFTGQPSDNDTITIARLDGSTVVYRFKSTMAAKNDVQIGADQDASLTNLSHAIAGTGTPGTHVFLGTEPCLDWDVTIDTGANTITLSAINYGDAYNTAVTAIAESTANFTWAAATSGVDTPDFREALNFGTAAAASSAPVARNGVWPVCPTAAQLTCKQVHFEFDDDSAADFERIDFVARTTDHPLAYKPNGCLYAGVLDDPTDLDSAGLYCEIPNLSHADDGDWLGQEVSVPDTDDIIKGMFMEIFNPYTGDRAVVEIKGYDFTDAAFGTNQGRVTFATGAGVRIPTTLRGAAVLYYRIYESNPGIAAEIKAKTDNLPTDPADASDIAAAFATAAGIRKNVALSNFPFYMETTTGIPATGKTVTVELSKDAGAFAAAAGAVAEISGGWYQIDLAQADTNADTIGFKATASGCKQTNMTIVTRT